MSEIIESHQRLNKSWRLLTSKLWGLRLATSDASLRFVRVTDSSNCCEYTDWEPRVYCIPSD